MNPSASLLSSAEVADRINRPELAKQYRLWAVSAGALGPIGASLYHHFATEAAEYVTARLIEFNERSAA